MRSYRRRVNVRGVWMATMAVAATMSTAGLLSAPAQAQQPVAPAQLVTLDIREARFEDAIGLLTTQIGASNVVIENVPGIVFGQVTVKMTEQSFDKVLRAVAASAQATVTLEDGIYYLRPRGAQKEEKPIIVAAPTAAPVTAKRNGPRDWIRIPLQYLVPTEFVSLLDDPIRTRLFNTGSSPLPQADEGFYNKPKAQGYPLQGTPQQTTIMQPNETYVNGAPSEPGAGRDEAFGAGQRGGGGRGGGGGGFGGGGQGFPGGGGGGFPGGAGGGQGGPGGGGGQNGSLRPEGIDQIISNDADNALLVVGDAQAVAELRTLIRLLDVAPKQVMIRAEFVSVSVQDADAFGVDWRISPAGNLDALIPSSPGAAPTITMAYSSGNAVANMRAALTRSSSNLIQAPIITTTNNTQAFIRISDNQPQFTTTQTISNGTVISNTTVQQIPATQGLVVTPHINGDNSISLALSPQLQTNSIVAGPANQTGVRTQTQTLTTYRRVGNGETMVLGGFITKQEDRSDNRVPLLSDLPIIGSLFRQKSRTTSGTEILVFVTPTIIEDRSAGVLGGGSAPAP